MFDFGEGAYDNYCGGVMNSTYYQNNWVSTTTVLHIYLSYEGKEFDVEISKWTAEDYEAFLESHKQDDGRIVIPIDSGTLNLKPASKNNVQTCAHDGTKEYLESMLGRKLAYSDKDWYKSLSVVNSQGLEEHKTLSVLDELVRPYGVGISEVIFHPTATPCHEEHSLWIQRLGANPLFTTEYLSNEEFLNHPVYSEIYEKEIAQGLHHWKFDKRPVITGPCVKFTGPSTGNGMGHATYVGPRSKVSDFKFAIRFDLRSNIHYHIPDQELEFNISYEVDLPKCKVNGKLIGDYKVVKKTSYSGTNWSSNNNPGVKNDLTTWNEVKDEFFLGKNPDHVNSVIGIIKEEAKRTPIVVAPGNHYWYLFDSGYPEIKKFLLDITQTRQLTSVKKALAYVRSCSEEDFLNLSINLEELFTAANYDFPRICSWMILDYNIAQVSFRPPIGLIIGTMMRKLFTNAYPEVSWEVPALETPRLPVLPDLTDYDLASEDKLIDSLGKVYRIDTTPIEELLTSQELPLGEHNQLFVSLALKIKDVHSTTIKPTLDNIRKVSKQINGFFLEKARDEGFFSRTEFRELILHSYAILAYPHKAAMLPTTQEVLLAYAILHFYCHNWFAVTMAAEMDSVADMGGFDFSELLNCSVNALPNTTGGPSGKVTVNAINEIIGGLYRSIPQLSDLTLMVEDLIWIFVAQSEQITPKAVAIASRALHHYLWGMQDTDPDRLDEDEQIFFSLLAAHIYCKMVENSVKSFDNSLR